MSSLKQLQEDVAIRMRRGDTFASVEADVIDPSGLSEAEKAALWLYAWSFVHWRLQRREAMYRRLGPGRDVPGGSRASACASSKCRRPDRARQRSSRSRHALGRRRGMVWGRRQPAIEFAQFQQAAHRPVAGQHHEA